jgi:hypothetical protein
MGVSQVDRATATAIAVGALGLDAEAVDFDAPEALAAALRSAASFLCPSTPGRLIRAVVESLAGLRSQGDDLRETLEDLLGSLVSYGDLQEVNGILETGDSGARLYLGPPAFVRRGSGSALLMGIRPEGEPLLGEDALRSISYERHIRLVAADSEASSDEFLLASGLSQVTLEHWHRAPPRCEASELVRGYRNRLDRQGPSGPIAGLTLLDTDAKVSFYRGRWRLPSHRDSGTFVARRARAFGAPLWCLVELANGEPQRLLDLPLLHGLQRGCDEAWRLQAAIDALSGQPQFVRVDRERGSDATIVDFIAPLPSWVQRRWDLVATPVIRRPGALFSYRIQGSELSEELDFLVDRMWLRCDYAS